MDSTAELVVTFGGFLVLTAVLGICFYLVIVVVPLFERGTVGGQVVSSVETPDAVSWVMVDPYLKSAALVDRSLRARVVLVESGESMGAFQIDENLGDPTTTSFALNGKLVAVGYGDGRVRLGSMTFKNRLIDPPPGSEVGDVLPEELGYTEVIEPGRARTVHLDGSLGEPIDIENGDGAVALLDYRQDPTGKQVLAVLREDGTAAVSTVRTIRPLGGGTPSTKLTTKSVKLQPPAGKGQPDWMFVTADSDHLFAIWEDGHLDRYSRLPDKSFDLIERVQLCDEGETITEANMLLGSQSVLIGRSTGVLSAHHVADDLRRRYKDNRILFVSHRIFSKASPIVALAPSTRDRLVAILHEDGTTALRHMTSEKTVAVLNTDVENASAVSVAPKEDGVLVLGRGGEMNLFYVEPGYPEFSVKALFGKVQYEGANEPQYVYQSSAGHDSSETKLSVMPLIFGSLKATVFAMLFAMPVGVLAALYSSEFVSKRVRRKVKPVVELMASLPSVVLGFVAAMVVAPYMTKYLDAFMVGLVVMPLSILLGAHLWQLIPLSFRLRLRSGQHMLLVATAALIGVLVSTQIGPAMVKGWFQPDQFDAAVLAGAVEPVPAEDIPAWAEDAAFNTRTQRLLRNNEMSFIDGQVYRRSDDADHSEVLERLRIVDGDLRRWLNGEYGQAMPGWLVVFFPIGCIIAWVGQAVLVRRRIDLWIAQKEAHFAGFVVLAKFLALTTVGFVIAYAGAYTAQALGFDPRDSIFGTFSPRNTLVVGLVMGFAVIPIIFTISEDALQAVPMTLRTASLGSGATPWQTAIRVVLPVAASGIFSACMIGFGRAVGETMIVLMATGNTPEMEWNIFSGFRTLAANIAVELPEAPEGSTHYRVLFLCGLVLFIMTFVINTMAELVRRVVRARNAGL